MRIRSFFIVITSLVALLHVYIGWRVVPDFPVGEGVRVACYAWLVLSCLLIPLGLLARTIPRQPLADRLAWSGLLSMGLFSSLLVLTFLRDVVLFAASFLLAPNMFLSTEKISAALVPSLALLATVIGFANARRSAEIVRVDIPLPDLHSALNGFTIAQISDIHVGPTIKGDYLQAIVDKVNVLGADMVAITGDLVDGTVQQLAVHTAPLRALMSRHGTFFVTGNHEYYSGEPAWTVELRRLGLTVLMNEHVILQHGAAALVVAGVADFSAHLFDSSQRSDPHAAMRGAPQDATAKILLAHQPRTAPAAAAAGFDLQLSGHTHGGQFWPWNHFVRLQQPYTAGLSRLGKLWVYTSRGTGYWGPPKRLGAPSEITLIRLVAAIAK